MSSLCPFYPCQDEFGLTEEQIAEFREGKYLLSSSFISFFFTSLPRNMHLTLSVLFCSGLTAGPVPLSFIHKQERASGGQVTSQQLQSTGQE